jgi:hypothetical protein
MPSCRGLIRIPAAKAVSCFYRVGGFPDSVTAGAIHVTTAVTASKRPKWYFFVIFLRFLRWAILFWMLRHMYGIIGFSYSLSLYFFILY